MAANNSNLYSELVRHLTHTHMAGLHLPGLNRSPVGQRDTGTIVPGEANLGAKSDSGSVKVKGLTYGSAKAIQFGKPTHLSEASPKASSTDWTKLGSQFASGGLSGLLSGAVGGLGLGSVVSGLLSLFGNGPKKQPAPLTLFQLPASDNKTVYVSQGGVSQNVGAGVKLAAPIYQGSALPLNTGLASPNTQNIGVGAAATVDPTGKHSSVPASFVSSGSIGQARTNLPSPLRIASGGKQASGSQASALAGNNSVSNAAPGIATALHHNVEYPINQPTMTSQWFLDNSGNIAKAVREAMLNSSAINDVISEI